MKVSAIQKQKEALKLKLAELAEKEKKALVEAKEKEKKTKQAAFEKNQSALASILFQHFSEDFVNLDLEVLKSTVSEILSPKQKEVKVQEVKVSHIGIT